MAAFQVDDVMEGSGYSKRNLRDMLLKEAMKWEIVKNQGMTP